MYVTIFLEKKRNISIKLQIFSAKVDNLCHFESFFIKSYSDCKSGQDCFKSWVFIPLFAPPLMVQGNENFSKSLVFIPLFAPTLKGARE
jgi:hypothetical protein